MDKSWTIYAGTGPVVILPIWKPFLTQQTFKEGLGDTSIARKPTVLRGISTIYSILDFIKVGDTVERAGSSRQLDDLLG